MIVRTPRSEIRAIVAEPVPGLDAHQRDEMAIPSYLHWNPLIPWLMWRRHEEIVKLAEIKSGDHVLEFGCGVGLLLPTLAPQAQRIYAVDLFPQYAQRLVERRGIAVEFVDDVASLADGSLNVVISADVMEHLPEPQETARLFREKLAPGGRVVISGPTENAAYKIGRFAAGFAGKGDYHHTNIDALTRDMTSVGFIRKDERSLPFRFAPTLFKVLLFERGE